MKEKIIDFITDVFIFSVFGGGCFAVAYMIAIKACEQGII